jgi:hypothetical protein
VYPATYVALDPVNASTPVPELPEEVPAHDPLKLRLPSEPAVNDIVPEPSRRLVVVVVFELVGLLLLSSFLHPTIAINIAIKKSDITFCIKTPSSYR